MPHEQIEQSALERQDARLDACRKARLRVQIRKGVLHMPPGSGTVAKSLGITLQDVERALLREDARLRAEAWQPSRL
jgi:hypothetical protein